MPTQHTLRQITPHVYWFSPDSTTDRPALGVVVGERATLLVDAGNSPAHVQALLAALDERGIPSPSYLVLTHWHWDHVFGTATLNLPTFAHLETRRIMRAMARLDWGDEALDQRVEAGREIAFCRDMIKAELPDRSALVIQPPEIGFEGEIELDLGGVTCVFAHVGGDHAHDSTVVLVREEGVLFLGDCFYDDIYQGPKRLTTRQLFPLLDRLLRYQAECYIGGHDPEPIAAARFQADAAQLMGIGAAVDRIGDNPEMVRRTLPEHLGRPLQPDDLEIADAFLAGLRMPEVKPVL